MPSFPVVSSQGYYRLGFSTPSYEPDSWLKECTDDSQDVGALACQPMYYTYRGPDRSNITRNVLFFDTTGLSPTLEIISAGIWAHTGRAGWVNGGLSNVDDTLYVVTAPDVHRPCIGADYGYLGGCSVVAASLYVPSGLLGKYRYLALTEAGIAAINPGALTPFGIRPGNDISISFPGWMKRWDCWFHASYYPAYLLINEPKLGGYIWVEATKFAYLDSDRDKRTIEGTLDGATGQTAGHLWAEGSNLRYIDSSGNERYIAGTQDGATGKIAGHIWIEETKVRYIDSSGNERCFEGT